MRVIDKTEQYKDAILYGAMLGKIMFIIADRVYTSASFLIDRDLGEKQDLLTAYFMKFVERNFSQEATLNEHYDDAKRLYGKYQDVIDPESEKNPSLITGKEALEVMCRNSIKIILEQLKKVSYNSIENTPLGEALWAVDNKLYMMTWVSQYDYENGKNAYRHQRPFREVNLTDFSKARQPYFDPDPYTDSEKLANNKWGAFTRPNKDISKFMGADINYPARKNKLLWQSFLKITPTSNIKAKPPFGDAIYYQINDIVENTKGANSVQGPAKFDLRPALYSYNFTGHVNPDYWEAAWLDFIENLQASEKKGLGDKAFKAARHIYRFPGQMYNKFEYGVRAVYLCDKKFYNDHKSAMLIPDSNDAAKARYKKVYSDSAYYIGESYGAGHDKAAGTFLIPIAEVTREYSMGDLTLFAEHAPNTFVPSKLWNDPEKVRLEATARIKMVGKKLGMETGELLKDLLKTNEMRTFMEYIFPYHLLPQMSAIYCIESLSNALMSLTTAGGIPSVLVNAGFDTLINKIRYSGVYMKNE